MMKLSNVSKGRLERPIRVTVYGPEGVGKSTFAAGAPNPIFIGAEDGTSLLDVSRFPEPKTWADILSAIKELTDADHDYKTVALDTLDWMEPMCWAHVCATIPDDKGRKHALLSQYPYGQGYAAAFDQWRQFLSALDRLRAKRTMHVVMVAHSHIRSFKNPLGEDYDRYELKLNNKASGLMKEWPDAVVFANYETLVHTEDNRAKGISSGKRVLYTERRAGFDAKNRFGLAPEMELSWDAFMAGTKADPRATAVALLKGLNGDDRKNAESAIERAGKDQQKLVKLIEWMRGKQ